MIRPRPTKTRAGFTLVELSLAMAFLAILLITIAILVIRIVSIYQAGLSIRAVSATGRQLIDDFGRSISGSPIVNVSYNPATDDIIANLLPAEERVTYKYYFQKTGTAEVNGELRPNTQLAGAFCTGLYTYLWNTAYALQAEEFNGISYTYTENIEDRTISDFRLLRIPDSERSICMAQRQDEAGKINPNISNFRAPVGQETVAPLELLSAAEDELALYDFRVFPASNNRVTGHIYYSATFILATLRGGVDIFSNGDYCIAEYGTLNTDFNYCAINKFNFAMRATGETKDEATYGER